MSNYVFAALVHILSLFIYQQTGEIEYMVLSAGIMVLSTFVFIVGAASLVSPELTIEIGEEEYERQSDYFGRGVLQIVVLLIAYHAYSAGYGLVAGIIGFQAVILLASCAISLWVRELTAEEQGDDEE